ncbi:MAG: N-acetylneuraminate synthase [Gammaproteobacteria bacterium RIFCSPHIGHO2_12_FULL_35_23]|nr:MAG: N-acetylneuraminate synthase [Gammaproteobacteria bacterium RIFCSPHIGHO2_12_FULL_35_23]
MENNTLIIAEAGVNHNGNPDNAFKLIEVACEAGADIVKFQTFRAKCLVSKNASKAEYQQKTTGSHETQFSMLKRLELSEQIFKELFKHCKKYNVNFLSTAFDFESLYFLIDNLGLDTLKIASGELTNAPLLLAHAQSKAKLIVSTGMATLGEVEAALGIVAFGLIGNNEKPSPDAFMEAYLSLEGQEALKKQVSLLHCTSEYPAAVSSLNLRVIQTMRCAFGLPVGYSDHSEGIHIPIAAVAIGAKIIEKHYTLDKAMEGPDHLASLNPEELMQMVKNIRDIERSLGNGIKIPSAQEQKNKLVVRKSLVAAKEILQGQTYLENNLTMKRPGNGLSPMKYWELLGKEAQRNYQEDELIDG